MHKYLCKLHKSGKSFLVLYGMSGVGKTELARKYAEQYHNSYESFVWLDAAFGNINTSMINLCHKLGIRIKDDKSVYFENEVIVEKIHNYYKNEKTLFIFDNVDELTIKNFESYVSNKQNSFTLVTSQLKCWTINVFQIKVNTFSAQEALSFMKNNIKANDDETLIQIAEEVGYHPLSLNHTILYISNNNVSLKKYLELLKSQPDEILNELVLTEKEEKSAIASINLVLNKIETNNELSLEMLHYLSYCDGQNVTNAFLHKICNYQNIKDDLIINRAIRLLVSYSLIDPFDQDSDKFTMHDITQFACIAFQKRKQKVCIDSVINLLKLELLNSGEHIEKINDWYDHLLFMFRKNKLHMAKAFSDLDFEVNQLFSTKGRIQDALNVLTEIENYHIVTYGEKDLLTLATKNNKACCIMTMGKYQEAFEIFSQIDKIHADMLAINHQLRLNTSINLADCMLEMGKYEEAFEIYCEVDKILSSMYGINHTSIMTVVDKHEIFETSSQFDIIYPLCFRIKNNKANYMLKIEKYQEAFEIYSELDKIQTEVLGINHPITLIIQ